MPDLKEAPIRIVIAQAYFHKHGCAYNGVAHPKWIANDSPWLSEHSIRQACQRLMVDGLMKRRSLTEMFGKTKRDVQLTDWETGKPVPRGRVPEVAYELTSEGRRTLFQEWSDWRNQA